MSKLYACVISEDAEKTDLMAVAAEFAYRIEMLEDGVLFDISGLERLIGTPDKVAAAILEMMESNQINGNLAVNSNLDSAIILAREGGGFSVSRERLKEIQLNKALPENLPLSALPIEKKAKGIFSQLGFREIEDLKKIPVEDLVSRFGKDFMPVWELINGKSARTLIPNQKDDCVRWESDLDNSITDFEQLMVLIEIGIDELFPLALHDGFSTELIEIDLLLENEFIERYEIRSASPTLDKSFWLKIIYLKMSASPPAIAVKNLIIVVRFTKPRPTSKGLFAVTRPEPEDLLLTVNKLKKLLGNENVGIPVLLNERTAEAFELDAEKIPEGVEKKLIEATKPAISFFYFSPPLEAKVLIRRKQLIYLQTDRFAGRVINYSGVWKMNSGWWDKSWNTYEWDVELENAGIYRLSRRLPNWFVVGEYD